MMLGLRLIDGRWVIEAEVGWSGSEVGWDQFRSQEVEASCIEEVIQKVPPIVDWLVAAFREEVAKLPS
jgi:hypothetical protein